jgi:hypothetical protein
VADKASADKASAASADRASVASSVTSDRVSASTAAAAISLLSSADRVETFPPSSEVRAGSSAASVVRDSVDSVASGVDRDSVASGVDRDSAALAVASTEVSVDSMASVVDSSAVSVADRDWVDSAVSEDLEVDRVSAV